MPIPSWKRDGLPNSIENRVKEHLNTVARRQTVRIRNISIIDEDEVVQVQELGSLEKRTTKTESITKIRATGWKGDGFGVDGIVNLRGDDRFITYEPSDMDWAEYFGFAKYGNVPFRKGGQYLLSEFCACASDALVQCVKLEEHFEAVEAATMEAEFVVIEGNPSIQVRSNQDRVNEWY